MVVWRHIHLPGFVQDVLSLYTVPLLHSVTVFAARPVCISGERRDWHLRDHSLAQVKNIPCSLLQAGHQRVLLQHSL